MIMDVGRATYKRRCKFYVGDDRETLIKWYDAPEGASFFTGVHAFWHIGSQKEFRNIPWEIGEDTSQPTVYSTRSAPYDNIVGDHFEGSETDFSGWSYYPSGPYDPYSPAPTAPECTHRPAVGVLGGIVDVAQVTLGGTVGYTGGDVLSCSVHTGTQGMGGGIVSVSDLGGPVGVLGGIVPVYEMGGIVGIEGGTWCGAAPIPHYSGAGALALPVGIEVSGYVFTGLVEVSASGAPSLPVTLETAGYAFPGLYEPVASGVLARPVALTISSSAIIAAPPEPLLASGAPEYPVSVTMDGWVCTLPPPIPGFTGLFNTGVDANRRVKIGTCPVESHWTIDGVSQHCPPYGGDRDIFNVVNCTSRATGPSCAQTNPKPFNEPYVYSLVWTIEAGTDLGAKVLRFAFTAEDSITEYRVNGNVVTLNASLAGEVWAQIENVPDAYLQIGANVIEFDIYDIFGGRLLGFRLEWMGLFDQPHRSVSGAPVYPVSVAIEGTATIAEPINRLASGAPEYPVAVAIEGTATVAAPFDGPQDLPNILAWADATQGTWQNSDGTDAAIANNDPVGRVDDISGNEKHFTAGHPTWRPLLKTAHQNGLSALEFDGVDDYLYPGNFTSGGGQPFTVFLVAAHTPETGTLLGGAYGFQFLRNAGQWLVNFGAGYDGGGTDDANWHLFTLMGNGASSRLFVDGTEITLGGVGGSGTIDYPQLMFLDQGTGGPKGYFGEIVVCSGDQTAFQAQMHAWAQDKWGTP